MAAQDGAQRAMRCLSATVFAKPSGCVRPSRRFRDINQAGSTLGPELCSVHEVASLFVPRIKRSTMRVFKEVVAMSEKHNEFFQHTTTLAQTAAAFPGLRFLVSVRTQLSSNLLALFSVTRRTHSGKHGKHQRTHSCRAVPLLLFSQDLSCGSVSYENEVIFA
eukprot:1634596-Amphidinium_carterae.1